MPSEQDRQRADEKRQAHEAEVARQREGDGIAHEGEPGAAFGSRLGLTQ